MASLNHRMNVLTTEHLGRGGASRDLLTSVGLSGYADRDVANLSGGEAQRVSLARALANSPFVLLLDEPTSALDDEAKSQVESLIGDIIRDTGLTCVVVTHDFAQAARMATRVMVLQAGRAIRIGPVRETRARGASPDRCECRPSPSRAARDWSSPS